MKTRRFTPAILPVIILMMSCALFKNDFILDFGLCKIKLNHDSTYESCNSAGTWSENNKHIFLTSSFTYDPVTDIRIENSLTDTSQNSVLRIITNEKAPSEYAVLVLYNKSAADTMLFENAPLPVKKSSQYHSLKIINANHFLKLPASPAISLRFTDTVTVFYNYPIADTYQYYSNDEFVVRNHELIKADTTAD